MATITKFEDLICWQKARELTRGIYHALLNCRDYGFRDQIQRAVVSILSNIAEGFERGTRDEFINYLFIAKGSAGEVRAQLYVALDAGYIDKNVFEILTNLTMDCSRLTHKLAMSIRSSAVRGHQFKREI
ncbi:MAG: four helix bundle protein [Patescibacteria group bacterium]